MITSPSPPGGGRFGVHRDDADIHQPAGGQHHLQVATAKVGGVFCSSVQGHQARFYRHKLNTRASILLNQNMHVLRPARVYHRHKSLHVFIPETILAS